MLSKKEKLRPDAKNFTYYKDYLCAMTKWRYAMDLGRSGHSIKTAYHRAETKAKWAIRWVAEGFPEHSNLVYKGTDEMYVKPNHRLYEVP